MTRFVREVTKLLIALMRASMMKWRKYDWVIVLGLKQLEV